MRRMYPEDRAAYERGEGVGVFTKRVRLEVVDFYSNKPVDQAERAQAATKTIAEVTV